ncbi:MAG: hypothetical protein HKN00_06835 [Flavobacteriaceae bacterium]|nr:hypothetical protein [Bacteroidia bacterium]MBT8288141.1 hypothetical protein [Bacteroidia bacterium]NNF74880.1 hypothetical protein [Flavobacteriaceae bacterium]NNK72299.1 hypothetical protein [Flavobacteriaceae bacterium]
MMPDNRLKDLGSDVKFLIVAFLVVLSIGFYSGILFVDHTTSSSPNGIVENYLGNEQDENASIMKFRKSEREMLSLIHGHVLSMALIFFALGFLVSMAELNKFWKRFLILEPFFSIVLTFGGMYLLWKGMNWMTYIIMLSGIVMTMVYTASVIIVLWQVASKTSE